MKRTLQRQDNLSGLTLDNVQKTRQRAILAQQETVGHWLQVSTRERKISERRNESRTESLFIRFKERII